MKRDIVTLKVDAIGVDGTAIKAGTNALVSRVFRTLTENGHVTRYALMTEDANRRMITQVPGSYFESDCPARQVLSSHSNASQGLCFYPFAFVDHLCTTKFVVDHESAKMIDNNRSVTC